MTPASESHPEMTTPTSALLNLAPSVPPLQTTHATWFEHLIADVDKDIQRFDSEAEPQLSPKENQMDLYSDRDIGPPTFNTPNPP